MPRRRTLEPMHDEHVNVTPLIDVIMCLIIFFLLCSQFVREETNDQVQIPRATEGQQMAEQQGRLLINVLPLQGGQSAEVSIRGKSMAMDALPIYLQKEKLSNPEVKVIIRADQDLPYNWISPVLVACAKANINSVNFATRRGE